MGDFIINNSSISCIDLKINNQIWPNDVKFFTIVEGEAWEI